MALARWQSSIVDEEGNVLPGASVTVRDEDTSLLANLFSDRAGVTPLGNPIAADSHGFAFFHVAGGAYRITATSGSFSRTLRYVGIGRLSEQDIPVPVVITTAGTHTVADKDELIIIKLAAPGTVTLSLGSVDDREDRELVVADSAITAAATVVINPAGGETLAGQSTGGFTSSGVGIGGSIKLHPSTDFSDWMIIP